MCGDAVFYQSLLQARAAWVSLHSTQHSAPSVVTGCFCVLL